MSQVLRSALAMTAVLCGALPALAQASGEAPAPCPQWFPDFSCDREGRYTGFIPPMTMPYLFEEPFVTSGVSGYALIDRREDNFILTPSFRVEVPTGSGGGNLDVDTEAFGSVDLSTAQNVLFGAGITDRRRFEGNDVVNLGSDGVASNDVVTVAFGARVPLDEHVSLGAAYEFPITAREDLIDQRATVNVVAEF